MNREKGYIANKENGELIERIIQKNRKGY